MLYMMTNGPWVTQTLGGLKTHRVNYLPWPHLIRVLEPVTPAGDRKMAEI